MQRVLHVGNRVPIAGGSRLLVGTLLLLAAFAWTATILAARSSTAMNAMPGHATPLAAALFAGMWLVMMAAMMLPAVIPVVLLFRTIQHQRAASGRAVPTAVFVCGYLAVWLLAGLGADLLYTVVQALGSRIPNGSEATPYLGGAILALAGLYQLTPLKHACLQHCRSPLHFVLHGWRQGRGGAVRMGATHGFYCLGCCSGIMAVLFVVGLMNLGWMAALSLLILAEKLAPRGATLGRAIGGLFIVLGLVMALRPGLFPAGGLAAGPSMNMAGMPARSAPAAGLQTYRTTAGPYAMTLTIGPAEQMLTLKVARRTHANTGEVMLDGTTAMSMDPRQRHLSLYVAERSMGMAVNDARVAIVVQGAGAPRSPMMLARMYDAKEGMKDLHYGANLSMAPGVYILRLKVNGATATLRLRVP